jgi:beta-lactamase superfamily II metal-dependent hydrolase
VYDADYETNTKHYRAYTEALKVAGVPRYRVSKETTLTVGGWSLSLLPTVMREAKDNDRSLIVVAEDSWRRFFFAADAEEARIAELLEMGLDKVDLVKMPHHGRYHSSLPDFLEALDAEIAVITDSQKKPAHEKTLSLLEKKGIEIFQTANGEIHIKSRNDGLLILQ